MGDDTSIKNYNSGKFCNSLLEKNTIRSTHMNTKIVFKALKYDKLGIEN